MRYDWYTKWNIPYLLNKARYSPKSFGLYEILDKMLKFGLYAKNETMVLQTKAKFL